MHRQGQQSFWNVWRRSVVESASLLKSCCDQTGWTWSHMYQPIGCFSEWLVTVWGNWEQFRHWKVLFWMHIFHLYSFYANSAYYFCSKLLILSFAITQNANSAFKVIIISLIIECLNDCSVLGWLCCDGRSVPYLHRWRLHICSLCFFTSSCFPILWLWLWCCWNAFLMPIDCIMCVPVQHLLLISQHERHSHHNKQKTAISVHQEEQGALPVSLCIPYTLFWPPLCICTLFLLLCNGHLMWLFVLYVLTAFLGLCFAAVAERTAHNLWCLPTQLPAVTRCDCLLASLFLHFSSFFFLNGGGGCPLAAIQCVCTTVMFSSPGTERFLVNTLQKAEPGQCDVQFLLN